MQELEEDNSNKKKDIKGFDVFFLSFFLRKERSKLRSLRLFLTYYLDRTGYTKSQYSTFC